MPIASFLGQVVSVNNYSTVVVADVAELAAWQGYANATEIQDHLPAGSDWHRCFIAIGPETIAKVRGENAVVLAIGDFDSGGFAHFFHLGDRLVVTEGSYKMDNPDFLAWIATPPKVKKVSGKIDIRTGMIGFIPSTASGKEIPLLSQEKFQESLVMRMGNEAGLLCRLKPGVWKVIQESSPTSSWGTATRILFLPGV